MVDYPSSIKDEAVRQHRLYLDLMEASLSERLNDDDIRHIAYNIVESMLDLLVPRQQLIRDLKSTILWLSRVGRTEKLDDHMLCLLTQSMYRHSKKLQEELQ